MSNIIYSDIYRLRHSAAMRNTLIGLLVTMLFLAIIISSFTTDGLTIMLDSTASLMTQEDLNDVSAAMAEIDSMTPHNAAEFGRELLSSNFMLFFFLPLIIAIFCADFTHGTYRNTLSYEDNRGKVYFAKLLLCIVCCIGLYAVSILLSWIAGGISLGFGGFTAEYLTHTAVTFLLMLPTQLAAICVGHCLVAFAKKSGAVIAIFIIAPVVLALALQTLAMLIPPLRLLTLYDWSSCSKLLIEYWTLPTGQLVTYVFVELAIATAAAVLGEAHYRRADLH